MNLLIKNNIDYKPWSEFVLNHPNGNIFQTPEMFEVYTKTKNYTPLLTCLFENEVLVGILVAVIQKEYKGLLGKLTARSIIWGGPLVKDDKPEYLDQILRAYSKKIKHQAIYTQFRNLWVWPVNLNEIFRNNDFHFEDHLDILINLSESSENIISNIKKNTRRNVTKSINKGVCFELIDTESDLHIAINLIKKTYQRIKLPFPHESLFLETFHILSKKDYFQIFKASVNNKIIGVRFELTYKNKIYDWFAGNDVKENNKYPNDFLIYHILIWGNNNKFSEFDFGGAGKPKIPYPVRDYKLKFDNNLVNLGRFEKTHQKLMLIIGKIGFQLYKFIYGLRK